MNKSSLIKNLSYKLESFGSEDVEISINLILDYISDTLQKGNRIEVRNFGTFTTRFRKQRISRNPKTGSAVLVGTKHHPYFRASKYLKQSLNK